MATPNIVPRADSEGGLGTASKYWASAYIDLIYVGAGKVGRDADNLIDFSTDNNITFRINTNNELTLDSGQLYPVTNNGLSLGAAGYGFSDLYLASGAVIKFNNGDVTLTHSNNALTLADGDALHFGTDNDLRLFHTSGESLIQNTVGHLYIQNTADDKDIIFSSDDGSGGVETYFFLDGSASSGNPFTVFPDLSELAFGTSRDLRIKHDGTDSKITNSTGDLYIINSADDKDIIFQSEDGGGGVTTYFTVDGSARDVVFAKDVVLNDNVNLRVGTGHDLQMYHDATDSWIKNSHGNLVFRNTKQNKDIMFQGDDGQASDDTVALYFSLDGSSATHDGSATTALYTNWPDKSRISLGTSHDLQIVHNATDSYIHNHVGDLYIKNTADDKDIIFQSDDGSGGITTYFQLDGSSAAGGTVYTNWADNSRITLGAGNDMQLYHDASNSYVDITLGNLYFTNYADDKDIIFRSDDGSGGVETYFMLDGSFGVTKFPDNKKVAFGDGLDVQIWHDGTNSYFYNGAGDLYIQNQADDKDIIFQSDNGSGGVETYFFLDGSQDSVSPYTVFPDSAVLSFGGTYDTKIFSDGTDTYIQQQSGDLYIQNDANDKDVILLSDDGSNGVTAYLTLDGSVGYTTAQKNMRFADSVYIEFGDGGDFQINHSGVSSAINNTTGPLYIKNGADNEDIIFQCDNGAGGQATYFYLDGSSATHDGSATTALYTNWPDNSKISLGTSGDLEIYHDGSHSYIDHTGDGGFYIRTKNNSSIYLQDTNGQAMAQFTDGGGSHLYHASNLKFSTTATGISVTGVAAAAVGGGFDGAETVTVSISEVNQETITTIQIDLGTGGATDIVSSGTAGDVIGENDTAAAFITKYDSTKNGVLYKAELICLETPAGGDTDINLVLNASSLAEDAAGETEGHVIVDGGAQTIGMRTESTASVVTAAAGAHNDYIYLTHGGTTAGTYSAGKFLIRLYGALATL